MFALPISVRLYLVLKALFFNQNSPKMKLFLQKNAKFSSAGGSASSPQNPSLQPPKSRLQPPLFFNQNSPKMKLFLQKNAKFSSAGGSASSPQNSPPLRISGYAPAAYLCARLLTCKSTLNVAKVQYKLREASGLNLPWYGKLWNGIWKKIASMEYGKIVFYSIPYHVLRRRGASRAKLTQGAALKRNGTSLS